MILGYIRVSTDKQEYHRQQDILADKNIDKFIEEKFTGKTKDRKGLAQLLDTVRTGDTVVVESISRLGRNTLDILTIIEELTEKGVEFVSVKENLDTSTPTGKAMLGMIAVIAQLERDLTAQRVKEGLESARKRGKRLGRPTKSNVEIKHALNLYDTQEYTIKEIEQLSGVSKSVLYKHLKGRSTQ